MGVYGRTDATCVVQIEAITRDKRGPPHGRAHRRREGPACPGGALMNVSAAL